VLFVHGDHIQNGVGPLGLRGARFAGLGEFDPPIHVDKLNVEVGRKKLLDVEVGVLQEAREEKAVDQGRFVRLSAIKTLQQNQCLLPDAKERGKNLPKQFGTTDFDS
jgi:hypothetical protein